MKPSATSADHEHTVCISAQTLQPPRECTTAEDAAKVTLWVNLDVLTRMCRTDHKCHKHEEKPWREVTPKADAKVDIGETEVEIIVDPAVITADRDMEKSGMITVHAAAVDPHDLQL